MRVPPSSDDAPAAVLDPAWSWPGAESVRRGLGHFRRSLRIFLLLDGAAKLAALWLWPGRPCDAAALFFGPDLFLLYSLFAPTAGLVVPVFSRFHSAGREVALTIDDGPDEEDTPRLLDLLERHRAQAVFFLVGERAKRRPDLVAEIIRRGHEVGHHTHRHPAGTFWCASPRRVADELDSGLDALKAAGAHPRWFRPPVGIKNLFLGGALARRGLTCLGWSLRTGDAMAGDPGRIARRTLGRVRPGDIILAHEGPFLDARVRVEAIRLILDGLRARGLSCVIPSPEQLR